MKRLRRLWPFVLLTTHERMIRENFELRGSIRRANEELMKHRTLLAGLRSGDAAMTRAVQKVFHD